MDPGAPWRTLEAVPEPAAEAAESGRSRGHTLALVAAAAAALVLVAASLGLIAIAQLGRGPGVQLVPGAAASGSPGASRQVLVVQVTGAVMNPGVYSLPAGSRVADAIKAAGGYSPDVDPRRAETGLNLAAKLIDAQSIIVPRLGDDSSESGAQATAGGILNLNTATAEQLDTLPGIGPATAARILASRAEQPFTSVDDLVTRKLVTAATLAKFHDQVTV